MNPRRTLFFPVLAALTAMLLVACERTPETEHLQFRAFGTLVEVAVAPAGEYDLAEIERELQAELDILHASWHAWEEGSLGRTNQLLPLQREFSAPPSVLPLIEQGRAVEEATDGLFNPAMGQLVAAWGFHRDEPAGPPPDADTLAELLEDPPSMGDIERNGVRLTGHHPDLQLDFGGLAKGAAVERARDLLADLGVEAAIVNAGGDLMTLGRPAGRDWRIGIRHPDGGTLGGIKLGGGVGLFTSGDYERGYEHEGERIHHVIDPRTGRPTEGVRSATVLHGDGGLADAAATTLMIAGPEHWPEYAARLGIDHALVVLADGRIEATPAMAARVELGEPHPEPEVRERPEAGSTP
ncbi:FAD:protein FMN transferase [Thioalkalivibrio halophilus]|uniref:FAD:protein FMN transferase n=1 Tax=Thioalkalivibrio halophilus TaxID=252474 RepID=A0A1V2ZWL0_9GAMM|nr:FAD:protein FMN transferase [Thioalkalivibrio halophilus]OOC09213.1 thiamine biosynthesis protein ApbE [Thioalkalivibrio halophilus]